MKRRPSAAGRTWPHVLVAAFICHLAGGALGQQGADPLRPFAETWRWRLFDRREGLIAGSVSAMHQDRQEFVYAGTERGVCRYDLWEWSALENASPFDDGPVERFVESTNGLFALTRNAIWKVEGGATVSLFFRGAFVQAAANDLGEVFVVDGGSQRHLILRGDSLEALDDVRLPSGRPHSYTVDPSRNHWLVTSDGLFVREVGRRAWRELEERDVASDISGLTCVRLFRVDLPPQRESAAPDALAGGRGWETWALYNDSRTAPAHQVLLRLEGGIWSRRSELDGPSLSGLVSDALGARLASTEDGRLLHFQAGGAWKSLPAVGVGPAALHCGLLDSAGILWFRHGAGGVAAFDARSRGWEQLEVPGQDSFPNVYSLLELDDGDVWLGLARGVTRLRSGQPPDRWDRALEVSLEKVSGLGADGFRRVWVSSAEAFAGALYHDLDEGGWGRLEAPGFNDEHFRRIATDRLGELWFLSGEAFPGGGGRVYRLSLATAYEPRPLDLPRGPVNDLVRARDDTFWIATDEGLLHASFDEERFTVDREHNRKNGLLAAQVWAVTEASDGSIWICYPGAGSGVTRIQDGELRSFQEPDGLASPDVWSITAVGSNVWFGTGRGLTRFDGELWYSYPVARSELASTRVWPVIPSRTEPDCILLGTFGQGAFKLRLEDRRRPRFTAHTFPARVSRDEGSTFTWDARDYRNQTPHDALLFRSRVDGGAWTRASASRQVEVGGLEPGRHRFEVEVRDLAGNRNREDLVHSFEVRSSGYERLLAPEVWGTALGAALVGLGLIGWLRLRRVRKLKRYARIFSECPDAAFILDASGNVVEWNGRGAAATGRPSLRPEEVRGQPVTRLPCLATEDMRVALSSLLRGEAIGLERRRVVTETGEERFVRVLGYSLGSRRRGSILFLRDDSLLALTSQLAERDRRLSSLRGFSARLLSDFNEACRRLREVNPPGSAIEESLSRFEEVARKLAAFSGGRALSSSELSSSPSERLEAILPPGEPGKARLRLAPGVKWDHRSQPGLWNAAVDSRVLDEILLEILKNACDAVGERGTITLRALNVRLEDDPGLLPAGSYVEISVKDTGPGMDAQQLERIFEPFYSTKSREQALGIGLAAAYGLARAHGGDLRVESRPGQGTTVRIFLPAAREA